MAERGDVVVSVPSGNFGNLTAGLMAKMMGLPIQKFVAATNVNDVVPKYLQNGDFSPTQSLTTISNAMDVGNPSNFFRMTDLYDFEELKELVMGHSFTDEETEQAMRKVFVRSHYTMDPHGAVAYLGVKKFLETHPQSTGIFLETAHPGKFKEVVEKSIEEKLKLPPALLALVEKKKIAEKISGKFSDLKRYLLK